MKPEFPEPLEDAPELPDSHPNIEILSDLHQVFLGRKSKYNHELVTKMIDYLDTPLYEDIKDEDGKLIKRIPSEMPSVTGLALALGIHRKTVSDWRRRYPEFDDYYELLKQKQERFLLYHGLNKNIDSNFGKFVAINVTDMSDKKEHSVSTQQVQINIDKDDADL